ncbi:unnamed protein product [Lepidochelys olivacea]
MLPTTSVSSQNQGNGALNSRDAARHTAGAKRYKYLRRLLHFRQMDFEFAVWQMLYLFTSPQRVYRNFHYRKQTKDQWARDDPAFLVLLSIWLCVSTIGFGFVLDMGFFQTIKLLLWVVFIDCVGVGLLIATLMWFISNKYLVKRQSRDYDVEWGYAFDVHLNAFYPLLVILHFIQLFFINYVISTASFMGYFVGNTVWLIAIGYYIYVTFLGYSGDQQPLTCGLGQFVYLLWLQVWPITAPPGCGSLLQANGGCGKWCRLRDVLAATSHSPHWPGIANCGQWKLRLAKPADAADIAIFEEHSYPFVSICTLNSAICALISTGMELHQDTLYFL